MPCGPGFDSRRLHCKTNYLRQTNAPSPLCLHGLVVGAFGVSPNNSVYGLVVGLTIVAIAAGVVE